MPKWWDPDDQVFVLVLVAAVISQTYTHKNVLGATADATITLLATAPSEAKPATVRQVQRRAAGRPRFGRARPRLSRRLHWGLPNSCRVRADGHQRLNRSYGGRGICRCRDRSSRLPVPGASPSIA